MPVEHLEHFLIQTGDMAAMRDWYVKGLGFRDGIKVELNYASSEAGGIKAELMASGLER